MARSRSPAAFPLLLLAVAFGLASSTAKATKKRGPSVTTNPKSGQPLRTHSGVKMTSTQIAELLARHQFPADAIPWAVSIAMRESGGDPGASVDTRGLSDAELHAFWGPSFDNVKLDSRGEYACGLWQINVVANPQYDPAKLLDADYAADAFSELSSGGKNRTPWATHKKGG